MRTKIIASIIISSISFVSYSMEEGVRRAKLLHTKSERTLPRISEEKSPSKESDKTTVIRSKSSQRLERTSSLKDLLKLRKSSSRNELPRSTSGLTRTTSSRSFGRTSSDLSLMSPSERSSNRSASPISCLHSDVEETRLKEELFSFANYSSPSREKALKKLKLIRSQGLTNLSVFDKDGFTPLRMAAKKGREGVVEALLELNVSPDIRWAGHNTPLIDAASGGHASIVALLLAEGAKIEACNGKGETALWCAVQGNHVEAVNVLLQAHADLNKMLYHQTVLMCAVKASNKKLVEMLLKNKPDLGIRDRQGKTALDHAEKICELTENSPIASVGEKFNCEEIVTLLKKAHEATVKQEENE